jgi:acyl-coenzyme A synthetase/AMP-(fatty) acid ligase
VAVIGWPETAPGSADGVVAFVQSTSIDELKVMSELASRLPAFMCPRPIICMDELPTTSNGKVDRSQLKSNLSA